MTLAGSSLSSDSGVMWSQPLGNESVRTLKRLARPVTGAVEDYDELLGLVGGRRLVLIGEASHGTHEFYRERARITRRLIDELGFNAVAIEGDWPDTYRVHRYVMGNSSDGDANTSLGEFRRFPTWMWRNRDVLAFVQWLRARNDAQSSPSAKVGFYGLDLYSLRASIEAVVEYLERVDPEEARRARERYSCFDHVGADGQAYGYSLASGAADPCEDAVVSQLLELRRRSAGYLLANGVANEDEQFYAEQNAQLVHDAEQYYRLMYRANVSSWNLRDSHMANTLDHLIAFLNHRSAPVKVVVWAHNSHVGDARATSMRARGELNIGQLARERYGDDALLIGFSTNAGYVTAASDWGGPTERKRVRSARPDSHEAMLHAAGVAQFWVPTRDLATDEGLARTRLERAIGVIYRPETELQSHYFEANLIGQFDVVMHVDHTHALEPLESTPLWDAGEPPETFPTGL
jgi:erythromycin esterase-like protein